MSLAPPRLDDRDWESLVEEAKRRIAAKCPAWTDFNPSDPGMVLVELAAWMTETVLYRLNRVPELNYTKFLELLGMRRQPPRPARTWVFFQIAAGMKEEALKPVPKGARISTRPQAGREPVTFTTCAELHLTTSRIVKTCSRYRAGGLGPVNEIEETHHLTGDTPWETAIFQLPGGAAACGAGAPHHLYFGDPALGEFGSLAVLGLSAEVENPEDGALLLEWEVWDGRGWQGMVPVEDTSEGFRRSGRITFAQLPSMKPRSVAQILSEPNPRGGPAQVPASLPCWIRARLVGASSELKDPASLRLLSLKRELGLPESRFPEAPRRAFFGTPSLETTRETQPLAAAGLSLQPIEINRDFHPFGPRPSAGSMFYIESPLFERTGALIQIRFALGESFPTQEGVSLDIHWEYPTADRSWERLGVSRAEGVTESNFEFKDATAAFTKSGLGVVEFRCPPDIARIEVAGQSGSFIRARLHSAQFEKAAGAAVMMQSVGLRFSKEVRPWTSCIAENYSEMVEHAPDEPFAPFRIDSQSDPSFYLCFNERPSPLRGPYHLFLDVAPQIAGPLPTTMHSAGGVDESGTPADGDRRRWLVRPEERLSVPDGGKIIWEYRAADAWKPLYVLADGTSNFSHEGVLEFSSPEDWEQVREFQQLGHWLRARWEVGEFLQPPRLRRVLLNGIEVEQRVREERVLGSSDGMSDQSFSLHKGILVGPEIRVRESDQSTEEEAGRLREESKAEVTLENDGCWVQWAETRSFFHSGPEDRHFTADLDSGTVRFGDGMHGKIPPVGGKGENIKIHYHVTLGRGGNVGVHAITVMETSLPGVQGGTNHHPGEGGADREDIESVMVRGPWEVKHRNRAVTAEDFRHLAKKASALVGPVECYQSDGLVCVIIVPNDFGEKPQPTRWLIEKVTKYLELRRLINVRFKVFGPTYEHVDAKVDLALDPRFVGRFSEVKVEAEKRLRTFVHPVTGLSGAGWPLGRTLHLSELYYQLEDLPGVDHVSMLKMAKAGTGQWEDNIRIGERSYPCFGAVEIEQSFD